MTFRSREADVVRLKHILEECGNIALFLTKEERDLMAERALERSIQIVGEACRTLSDETKARYPNVPWQDIVGMRHVLVHEYYRIDEETVWKVAEHKIPALKDWILSILHDIEQPQLD